MKPFGRPVHSRQGHAVTTRLVALALGVTCGFGFFALYLIADRTLVGQRADDLTFRVVFGLVPGGWPVGALSWFARTFVVEGLAAVVLAVSVTAVVRRAWRGLLSATVVVAASVGLTLYLRDHVLIREPLRPEAFPLNSMPSTHASAAAALVAAAVILWPGARPRWLGQVGGVVVLFVTLGNVVSQAHRPSDVVASLILVAGVVLLVTAVAPDRPAAPG